MSSAVCEMRTAWWLPSKVPVCWRKFSRWGICSRSEGTFGLSRVKWTLSNTTKITCWILPRAGSRLHDGPADAEPHTKHENTNHVSTNDIKRAADRNAFTVFSSTVDLELTRA